MERTLSPHPQKTFQEDETIHQTNLLLFFFFCSHMAFQLETSLLRKGTLFFLFLFLFTSFPKDPPFFCYSSTHLFTSSFSFSRQSYVENCNWTETRSPVLRIPISSFQPGIQSFLIPRCTSISGSHLFVGTSMLTPDFSQSLLERDRPVYVVDLDR
jgi:hypothetical protein